MKRFLLTLIISFLSTSVNASQWKKFFEIDSAVFWVDPIHVQKEGNRIRVWELLDMKKLSDPRVKSMRAQIEYDCKEKRSRMLYLSNHSEQMAEGETLGENNDPDSGKWSSIPPGTFEFFKLNSYCREYGKMSF